MFVVVLTDDQVRTACLGPDGALAAVAGRLADLMRKDVIVVREVARAAGADLGIIGTVLASDAVEDKVLRPADPSRRTP